MKKSVRLYLIFGVVLALFWSSGAYAANTYEDLSGRFAIDLPEGWKLQPQTNENAYIFKGSGHQSIIIGYEASASDLDSLFNDAVDIFRDALPDAALQGDITDLKVNNNPARWATYSTEKEVEVEASGRKVKVKVPMFVLTGAAALKDGGLYFVSYLNSDDKEKMGKTLEKAFYSIRNVGQAVTGKSEENIYKGKGNTNIEQAQVTKFTHKYLTLDLPPGWKQQEISRNSEKETVGRFKSDKITGANVAALCYQGMFMKKESVLKAGRQSVESAVPNAKITKEYEADPKGKKIQISVYQGSLAYEGKEIPLAAVTAIMKTDQCWLNLLGFVSDKAKDAFEKEIIDMANSAK